MASFTIPVAKGGQLQPSLSAENVGPANWVEKVNMRRDGDIERRREGWSVFRPNTGGPAVQSQPAANINLLAECVRPNGERVIVAANATTIVKFDYASGTWVQIGSGFSSSGNRWQWATMNGFLVLNNGVDLPVSYRVEESAVVPLHELRDLGVASVGHIEEVNGIMLYANLKWIRSDQLAAFMAATPYATPSDSICEHVPFDVVWSEIGQPRNFAPQYSVTMSAAGTVITLPWATQSLKTGDKVAVLNAGLNGGVLGGTTGYEDGIPITVSGTTLTLGVTTNTSLTYPRKVTVLRWADQSSIVGKRSLKGDGSPIIAVKKLAKQAVLYRTTGIYTMRYTGDLDAPWSVTERYSGPNVPRYAGVVASWNDDFHFYPASAGGTNSDSHFYRFNGLDAPDIFTLCEDAAETWNSGLTDSSSVWVLNNPLTRETWLCKSGAVMAVDTVSGSVGFIDATIHAACYGQFPNTATLSVLLFDGADVCRYGGTFLRKGAPATAKLKSGLAHLGSEHEEKALVEYVPVLASSSPEVAVSVKILATYNPAAAPVEQFTESMAYSVQNSVIYCHALAIYFQDEITLTDTRDVDFRLSSRVFNYNPVGQTRSTPRKG